MVGHRDDEETPLVQRPLIKTPLPWGQFWVVLLLQVSDPFASQTLAPFAPEVSIFLLLVRESHDNRNFV